MARQIEAYKLRTELAVDASKGTAAIKSFQKEVDNTGASVKKLGGEIDKAGEKSGKRFGDRFGAAATTAITGSIDSLGQTIGSIIGTVINPGLGTAIGSTIGSMVDKLGSSFTPMIKQGLELNKVLEQTQVEFTTFAGSASEAKKYLDDLKKMAVETGTDPKFLIETSERLYDLTDNLKLSTTLLKAATDQAADFGGSAEVIAKVADSLGLVAEKGELATRDLKALYKVGIDAKQYLAAATGLTEKQIAKYVAEGRIRGDVASRLIAEGIERKKGGYAAQVAGTTLGGAERRFGARMQITEAAGTEKLAGGLKDMYQTADKVLSSATAQKLVSFLDSSAGQLIDFAERGIRGGLDLAQGVAEGISGTDAFKAVGDSLKSFGTGLQTAFDDLFDIHTPSHVMEREVGIPLGQGIALGIGPGFAASFGQSKDQIIQVLESLLRDPRVQAMMDVIGKGEGTITKSGQRIYNKIFGGQRVALGTEHPNVHVPFGNTSSTAAGFGQILHGTWEMVEKKIGRKLDFSNPHDQELAVAFLMFDRGMIAPLMQGDIAGAIKKGAPEWASLPTSPYGQPTQKMSGALSTYSSRLAAHAGGVQPVAVVQWGQQDITGAAGQIFGGGGGGGGFGQQDIQGGAKAIFGAKPRVLEATADIQSFVQTINDSVPVIVEAQKAQEEEIVLDRKRETAIQYISSVTMKSLTPLEQQRLAEIERTKTAIALTKESQKASREQLIRGQDILGMLGGAVGQIAGMMPQQTVGKKRGLFSKILGIAAPFLNFIPGVGPILSTIAGAASAGLGGNWGGVVSSVAGGLASGGAFNPLRDDKHVDTGAIASTATPMATSIDLKPLIPRAGGGPVYRGARYVVGERGAETFTPAADGFITPHGGGGGLLEAAAELRAAVSHLNSMPASHVVMRGAHGLVRAMDADAGLIRLVSQRQRLA